MTRTNTTTGSIIVYLIANGHVAHRNNTTGVFDPTTKRWRTIAPASKGVGDILCCLKGGRYLEIEVKTGKDRLSPQQYLRQETLRRAGGFYLAPAWVILKPKLTNAWGAIFILAAGVVLILQWVRF
jgi:hypothetical protein